MRKDIKIGINTGDFQLFDTLKAKIYPISVVLDGDTYLDLQIVVPSTYNFEKIWTDGLTFNLSYIPIFKPIRLYICKDYGGNSVQFLINPADNSTIFPVQCKLYNITDIAIKASELITINKDFVFRVIGSKEKGVMQLYSGVESDFKIINANKQNADLLLKCIPSNHYRYPTSGVGLALYLNSNVTSTELSSVIKQEFEKDSVTVNNASFDSETGELIMDLDTTIADANV